MLEFLLADEIFVYPDGDIFKVRRHGSHFYGVEFPIRTRFMDEHGTLWEVVYRRPASWGAPAIVAERIPR